MGFLKVDISKNHKAYSNQLSILNLMSTQPFDTLTSVCFNS